MATAAPSAQFGARNGAHLDASCLQRSIGVVVAVVSNDHTRTQAENVVAVIPLLSLALLFGIAAGWHHLQRLVAQNFWGTRFDYFANEHLTIGSTIMRLTERPFTQKVTFGDDPIKNTVLGFDANYQNEFPWLTRTLDKLPIYSTSAPSLISLSGEVAGIFPGHQRFINAIDPEGSVFIDDFEGTNSSIELDPVEHACRRQGCQRPHPVPGIDPYRRSEKRYQPCQAGLVYARTYPGGR